MQFYSSVAQHTAEGRRDGSATSAQGKSRGKATQGPALDSFLNRGPAVASTTLLLRAC